MTSREKLQNFLFSAHDGIFLYDGLPKPCGRSSLKTAGTKSYLFTEPIKTLRCKDRRSITSVLQNINRYVTMGYYAAGFLSYEAGYAFEDKFDTAPENVKWPLLEFGIFKSALTFTDLDLRALSAETPMMDEFWVHDFTPTVSEKEYSRNFAEIKNYIKAGDVYQINYCFALDFKMRGSLAALFNALTQRQKVAYAAFIKMKDRCILSLSPEMFFDLERKRIAMQPMKGTLLKTGKSRLDNHALLRFRKSDKNHAENLMIVDLIRNDLSRLCKPDSVKVPRLFTVENYETLYQMTSTIAGVLKGRSNIIDILTSLFPSGSVTGAPKIRAMEIIRELETEPRGIYTGAIGFFGPHKKKMLFNIPIRTLVIDTAKGEGRMGIGSGIVIDSKKNQEYKECLGKARFLTGIKQDHKLIETMLYQPGKGVFLLDAHLERLQKSAYFFGIPFNAVTLRKELEKLSKRLERGLNHRIRVLLNAAGEFNITFTPLAMQKKGTQLIGLSKVKIDPDNIFWYHKTTNRALYDREHQRALKEGYFDTIFTNIRGEITEGCITNIFVKKNGIYYTPPMSCGLLPGTYRQYLLNQNKRLYKEKVLRLSDLKQADALFLCNSVRGMLPVKLVKAKPWLLTPSTSQYPLKALRQTIISY